ncbi:2Fe-2S iron-sulfur cluster-binding protein [Prauserella rugosa]|uniref:2Fe-2S ferredoxin n=1 Tax=Prauserella rugosa TaxID=43354 RepID=A0A660CAD7_9PSEU|nr:2Fe-2S iron-sulfur cluster-binding protein [Prauserella rugosa]KID30017.1 ferredoxin [Prauserella sp. Am3]KMS89823.1 ferredoxin [Streptomyces regensis]TWH18703.1 2Fe-2S ferredoxin [Prauserella rugosa]
MPTVIFHHANGETDVVESPEGTSVMKVALQNDVAGIVGECGGQAMCATCHVYVRDGYRDRLPEISEDEEEMLECTAAPRDEARSRLGCQVVLGPDLEEVEVDVPGSQV